MWMGSHDTDELYYMHQHFFVFINISPDNVLFRPKLVANIWNKNIFKKLCQTEYIFYIILILTL